MANILLRQVVSGKNRCTAVIPEEAFTAVETELVGELQQYTEEGTQGALSAPPAKWNKQRYSLGKKTGGNYENCSLTFPHVKLTVSHSEVSSLVKTNLNANYVSTKKPTYCHLLHDYGKEA